VYNNKSKRPENKVIIQLYLLYIIITQIVGTFQKELSFVMYD